MEVDRALLEQVAMGDTLKRFCNRKPGFTQLLCRDFRNPRGLCNHSSLLFSEDEGTN